MGRPPESFSTTEVETGLSRLASAEGLAKAKGVPRPQARQGAAKEPVEHEGRHYPEGHAAGLIAENRLLCERCHKEATHRPRYCRIVPLCCECYVRLGHPPDPSHEDCVNAVRPDPFTDTRGTIPD
jgi:hypothetical protein